MNQPSANRVVAADYPGGNIGVEKLEGDQVWLAPDFRHMQEGCTWFYWSFQPRNRTPLTAIFSHRNYIGGRGPAFSRDGGATWVWLGRECVRSQPVGEHGVELSFDLPPAVEGEEVRYAFCPQYQQSHLEHWLARHQGNPYLSTSEFCRSRKGRLVERIRIGSGAPGQRRIVWLMARNHSCEAMASYVLEGFLDAALEDDETGRKLRSGWEIIATPWMDKDGVEEGDQGKLRHPHDHNRDYGDQPIYPEVAAALRFGRENRNAVAVFVDLHCPMVHGPWDRRFYLVGSPLPAVAANQQAFMEVLNHEMKGSIRPHPEGVLAYGKAWNTGANYTAGKSAALWAAQSFPEADLIASFEVPYADADAVEVNPETGRALGRDLAAALLRFLMRP